jgi:drug/metabolite transporter (DMT)-like permease
MDDRERGIPLAVASAMLLGLTPIFGKQAINSGVPPLTVVAVRTAAAALLLLLVMALFRRKYLYIYPVGLIGCLIAGGLNGIGSLFYYAGLARVGAGLGQLLYSLYPVYVALLLVLDGQRHSRLTTVRLLLSIPAVILLTRTSSSNVDLIGVGMMLASGLFYGLHIPINQRVLYEAPAPTVTLYTLLAMTAVVLPAHVLSAPAIPVSPQAAFVPLIGLTAVTFFSRLALFEGVKSIGGMQTALLGLAQLLVSMALAILWLGERLSPVQWLGAALLVLAMVLVGREPPPGESRLSRGWLRWLAPPLPVPQPAERRRIISSSGD